MNITFDKERFARCLEKAIGNRSINQYALHSKVSATYISRLLRGMVNKPPGALIIRKLANKAQNGVTYHDLMEAAGHLPPINENEENTVKKYIINHGPDKVLELMSDIFSDDDMLQEKTLEYKINQKFICLPVVSTVLKQNPFITDKNIEEYIQLPTKLAKGASFAFKVSGNSMMQSGIYDNDYLVVRQQQTANNGQTILTFLGDTITVKRFYKLNNKVVLEPYPFFAKPLYLKDIVIIGVVLALFRQL